VDSSEGEGGQLGAAVRFFQCGDDITIQTTSEGLRRLASALQDVSNDAGARSVELTYTAPESRRPGVIRIESVDALTTSAPAGRNWVVPVVSVAGIIWIVVLPLVGVCALIWLLFSALR
jgi:hypothetical protein